MKEIEEYIDKMEKVLNLEKEKDFPKGIINASTGIMDILSEILTMVKSENDIKRLEKDVSALIDSLVSNCEKGDQTAALGAMRQLRDKTRYFRYYLSQKK